MNEIYKRYVLLDENNYIVRYSMTEQIGNEYYLSIDILHSERLNCWKLVNDTFIYDTTKAHAEEVEENRLKEIAELKKKLSDSDYIWNVIKEGDATEEDYADVIANRHTWRMRVRELEG